MFSWVLEMKTEGMEGVKWVGRVFLCGDVPTTAILRLPFSRAQPFGFQERP